MAQFGMALRNAVQHAARFRPAPGAVLQVQANGHTNTVARQCYVALCPNTGAHLATFGRGPGGWWHQPTGTTSAATLANGQPWLFATSAALVQHYHGPKAKCCSGPKARKA